MINTIEIYNYKCFPELIMDLGEMTILTGANAAGKSSVIQALLLADYTLNVKDSYIDVSKALGIQAGGPKSLISQNSNELDGYDFRITLADPDGKIQFMYKIDKLSPLKLLYEREGILDPQNFFYLNAERTGPRISYSAGIDDRLLNNGENAAFLIDKADMEERKISDRLCFDGKASKFSIHVEQWMDAILGDVSFSVSTDLVKALTDIRYKNAITDEGVLPTMTGFGISYILSIVTAGLWCTSVKNAILIVENPEAHLHPLSQSRMGKFLQLLTTAGVQVIVETHSEHIIDGARIQAAIMKKTDDLKIKFLSGRQNEIKIKNIEVNSAGELSEWPEGFFDQKTADLRDLYLLRRGNDNKKPASERKLPI